MPRNPRRSRFAVALLLLMLHLLALRPAGAQVRRVVPAQPIAAAPTAGPRGSGTGRSLDSPLPPGADETPDRPFPPDGDHEGADPGGTQRSIPPSLILALLLSLAGATAVVLGRHRLARAVVGQQMSVVAQVTVGPRQAVSLVRVADRLLLVGTGATGPPAMLADWNDPEDVARLLELFSKNAGGAGDASLEEMRAGRGRSGKKARVAARRALRADAAAPAVGGPAPGGEA